MALEQDSDLRGAPMRPSLCADGPNRSRVRLPLSVAGFALGGDSHARRGSCSAIARTDSARAYPARYIVAATRPPGVREPATMQRWRSVTVVPKVGIALQGGDLQAGGAPMQHER
jgi:hypothetical protein